MIGDSSVLLLWSDRWYPMDFNQWSTVRTVIHLPPGFQAVAPGRLVSESSGDAEAEFEFATATPTRYLSVFADARWVKTSRVVNGIPMQTLLYPASQRWSERILATSAEVLRGYGEAFGAYAADQFSVVTMEHVFARRALAGLIVYSLEYLDMEYARTGYDAHETALQWWGYTTAGRGPGSFQWTEGFGDYAEVLYTEGAGKPLAAIWAHFRRQYLAMPTDSEPRFDQLRGTTSQAVIHGKYPWLLHVMRFVVGDSAFRRGLRLVFDRYRFQTFTIDQFVTTMEEGTGQSLQWWRTEWLERTGVPHIGVHWSSDSVPQGWRVSVTLTQAAALYHFPVEIGITTDRGVQVERVSVAEHEDTFTIHVPGRPQRVTLDPHGWLLAVITER